VKAFLSLAIVSLSLFGCVSAVQNSQPAQQATPEVKAEEPVAKPVAERVETSAPVVKEWKGACRKFVNEGGKEIKSSPFKRLQSSYIFDGKQAVWFVKSYSDTKCQTLYGGHKYTFKCEADPSLQPSRCSQETIESWENGQWKLGKMVDYAGYPNQSVIQYFMKVNGNKGVLKSRSISDDGDEETQSLSL